MKDIFMLCITIAEEIIDDFGQIRGLSYLVVRLSYL